MKQCTECRKFKLRSDFTKRTASKDGLRPCCKKCVREYQQRHYHGITNEEHDAYLDGLRDKLYKLMQKYGISYVKAAKAAPEIAKQLALDD